jgi:Cyclic nucleotide-binding domain
VSPTALERRATAPKAARRQSAELSSSVAKVSGAKVSGAKSSGTRASKSADADTLSKSTASASSGRQVGKKPAELVAGVPLFASLSTRQLNKVARSMKSLKFSAGQTVIATGDTDARFYLIVDGTAKVVAKGRKRAEVGPGAYFGEMAMIDGEPRSASVVALTDLETLSLSRWNFEALLKEQPSVMLAVLRVLSKRLRECNSSPTD